MCVLLECQVRINRKLAGWCIIHKYRCCLAFCCMYVNFFTAVFTLSRNRKTRGLFLADRYIFLRKFCCMFKIPWELCLVDHQPVPCLRWEFVNRHFCHFCPPDNYPILPFISRRIKLFISTAYSRGSSFDTLSANPLTSNALASSSLMPRDIR